MIRVVLLDLDGVVRHFDPAHVVAVERRHGLEPGVLQATAFAPDVIDPVVTGRLSRREWTVEIGRRVGCPAAADEWLAARGSVDDDLLAAVDRLRVADVTVAVLTNGTDTVADELAELGVTDRFDAVFNSADIGVAKPDRRAFEHVCVTLAVDPADVFFTDDTPSKLAGAVEIGMTARPYRGVDTFRADITELTGLEV